MRAFDNFIILLLLAFTSINVYTARNDAEYIKAQIEELQSAITQQE